ncbi:MAG: nucleotidyltransferase [Fimbriimonadaceae bacterium]|nr:nucleotidyltransferase [Fimbriimonadaceae bacterium]
MLQKPPEFTEILHALNRESVRFVIIGGLALVLQGGSYVTFDLDLALASDPENGSALIRALAPYHPFPPNFGSADRFVWDDRSFRGAVISLVTDLGHLDLLLVLPGVDSFESLYARAEDRIVAGAHVKVAAIDDLIAMKESADRPKDRAHLDQLIALKKLRFGDSE